MNLCKLSDYLTKALLLLCFCFVPILSQAQEEGVEDNLVLVEPPLHLYSLNDQDRVPYKDRKQSWGFSVGLAQQDFTPESFWSPVVATGTESYTTTYGSSELSKMSLQIGLQKNYSLLSISLSAAYSYFENTTDSNMANTYKLTVSGYDVGLMLNFDGIWSEPYWVPFVGMGIYKLVAEESFVAGLDIASEDDPLAEMSWAPFLNYGFRVQLNSLDQEASINSYYMFGLQNTYLLAELRTYLDDGDESTQNLSADSVVTLGLHLEY